MFSSIARLGEAQAGEASSLEIRGATALFLAHRLSSCPHALKLVIRALAIGGRGQAISDAIGDACLPSEGLSIRRHDKLYRRHTHIIVEGLSRAEFL